MARAQVVHLGMVLASYEAATSRDDWRTPSPHTGRYLHHIQTLGYLLSTVESRALPA